MPSYPEDLEKDVEALKGCFDLIQNHVIITDTNGYILYANKSVEDNTGYSFKEIIGKRPGELWGGNMPKNFYEAMWKTIKTDKEPFLEQVKNTRKDGTKYWQLLKIFPIVDDAKNLIAFIGIEPSVTAHAADTTDKTLSAKQLILGDKVNDIMAEPGLTMTTLRARITDLKADFD